MPAAFSVGVDEEKDLLVARGCTIRCVHFVNADAGVRYVQLFDAGDVDDVTLGTTTPDYVVPMGSSATGTVPLAQGLVFTRGCVACATTTATGSTAVTSDAFVSIVFD